MSTTPSFLTPILKFSKHYWQFTIALLTLIIALLLQLTPLADTAKWVMGIISLVLTIPLLRRMLQDIMAGRYGIDILAATAIVTSVLLSEQWAAILVVLMLTGGEALEDFAGRRAQSELRALLERAPVLAHIVLGDKVVDTNVAEVAVGDIIEIRSGDVVPVDAVIVEGSTSIDESSLTGESLPQIKQIGDEILSGSVVIDGVLRAKVIHTAENSQYQTIIKLVQQASESQSPFVRMADRYSIPFTIAAYLIGVTVWVLSGDPVRFLEVIVVATPCPLLLAAPIALISGMSRASKYGIIVKTGSALEGLAQAKTIAFDKTGTLTHGTPTVDTITPLNNHDETTILRYAASIEQASNHILAEAIVSAAKDRNITLSRAQTVKEMTGSGLSATIEGQTILVGHYAFMEESGVKLAKGFNQDTIQQTATYVAINDVLAGVISFKDEIRKETQETLATLRTLGIQHILMLTGDNEAAAKTIADKLGITHFYAHLLPADKLNTVNNLTSHPVVFVGDGVNDAPVLTAATVGIALGAKGSTAASESADLVIMKDDLMYVAKAVAIAKRTFSIARQSIFIGIGLSVGLMLVFATGKFSPVAGALIQEVVDVVVVFNALRAHSGRHDLA
jgi:heavy metal translocating P-type ATPase